MCWFFFLLWWRLACWFWLAGFGFCVVEISCWTFKICWWMWMWMCIFCILAFVVDEFSTRRACLTLFDSFIPKGFWLGAFLTCQSFRIPIWLQWWTKSHLVNPMHAQDALISLSIVNFIGHTFRLYFTLFCIFVVNFTILTRDYLFLTFQDNMIPWRSFRTIFTSHSFSIIVRSLIRTLVASKINITPERSLRRASWECSFIWLVWIAFLAFLWGWTVSFTKRALFWRWGTILLRFCKQLA